MKTLFLFVIVALSHAGQAAAAPRTTPGSSKTLSQARAAAGRIAGREAAAPAVGPVRDVDSAPERSGRPVGELGFPDFFKPDLMEYKSGTFRLAAPESPYAKWKAGDVIQIALGPKGARKPFFISRVASSETKRLRDLTLNDLRSEFPPERFTRRKKNLRLELQAELYLGLQRFYPDVTPDSLGYMIVFEPHPDVKRPDR